VPQAARDLGPVPRSILNKRVAVITDPLGHVTSLTLDTFVKKNTFVYD